MRLLPWLSDGALDALQADVAFVLLGLSMLSLPRAYRRVRDVWQPEAAEARRALAGVVALASVLRWVVAPHWIVTIYIGYHLTQQAIDLLPVSHYGVGSSSLYHALFSFLPRDHRTLLWVNSILGVATLPLVGTFARRYFDDARAGLIGAALLAALPLFIKNDNSDANHIPCLWWLYGSLVLWDEYLETRGVGALVHAAVLAVLAAIARPEMPILLPTLLALVVIGRWPPREVWRDRWLYLALALALVALIPQVEHVLRELDSLQQNASLPGLGPRRVEEFTRRLRHLNTLTTPSLFPRAVLAAAALGLLIPGRRLAARWALAVAAVPAWSIYSLDLCRANMARVHVPSAQLVSLVAAAGISALLARIPWRSARVLVGLGFVAAVLPDAVASARTLWAATNEQAEEVFLREAIGRLPQGRLTLVRIGHGDRAIIPGRSEYTHDHFPDYLITPPAGEARVSTIREWAERPDWSAPAFFYSGMRCYARMRPPALPTPRGDNYQETCRLMHDRFVLEPVLERVVTNRGDVWLEYYGDAPTLRLTLYRVRPRP